MKTVYLGLGSNLGDRRMWLQSAVDRLHRDGLQVQRVSSVWETEPVDCREQGWFLNAVVQARTSLFPVQLMRQLLRVEADLGRRRAVAKGPRVIDIDLLFYGQSVIDSAVLTVPHPRLHQRRFVLAPLAELAPRLRHPCLRKCVADLLNEAAPQRIAKAGCSLELPARAPR